MKVDDELEECVEVVGENWERLVVKRLVVEIALSRPTVMMERSAINGSHGDDELRRGATSNTFW